MRQIESYPFHGGQLRQIAKQFGIPASQLLDFSANINPDGPPSAALSAIRDGLSDLSTLTQYPDLEETELRESIARFLGIEANFVSVANGFVPLLEVVLRTLRIRHCLLPVPSFVEYRRTLERVGIEISTHSLIPESGFRYDPATLLAGRHDVILLANPQNPSGVCHDVQEIRALVALALQRNVYVLLDEAFIDYVPERSLTRMTAEFPNLVVFRSVTKFYCLPGLRIAYVVANPDLSQSIRQNMAPWLITTLASRAITAALDDKTYADRSRAANSDRRDTLQQNIQALGFAVYPSEANFLLFRLPSGLDPNSFWRDMIAQHRIVLRSCANYDGLLPGHFRAAVRSSSENALLTAALEKAISGSTLTSAWRPGV
jgi:threonine-phosphate decarboxylase